MKIVMLMGGLGNQMFQWAFGYALSKELNEEILYDISWFENVKNDKSTTPRDFQLLEFNILPKFATNKEKECCINEQHIKLPNLPKAVLDNWERAKKYVNSFDYMFENYLGE